MLFKRLYLVLLALLGLGACATLATGIKADCSGTGTLEGTAACFHMSTDAPTRYNLLSQASQHDISLEAWASVRRPNNMHDDGVIMGKACRNEKALKVLATPTIEGQRYGLIELTRRCERSGKRCMSRETRLWHHDNGRWRRLTFPKAAHAAGTSFNEQRYAQAPALVGTWRKLAPLSMAAHRVLGWVLDGTEASAETKAKHIAAMRAINPNDSQTHLIAASLAADFASGAAVLEQMAPDDCLSGIALNNVLGRTQSLEERLALIDLRDPKKTSFEHQRFLVYADLKRSDDAAAILTGSVMKSMFADVQAHADKGGHAYYGKTIGMRALKIGHPKLAQPWLKLAHDAQPSPELAALLAKAEGKPAPTSHKGACKPSIKNSDRPTPQNGPHTAYNMRCDVVSMGHFKDGKRHGNWVENYFMSSNKKEEGRFATGLKEGLWTTFDRAGNPEEETNYLKGKRHGPHVVWRDFKTKVTAEEGAFVADQPHGPWQFYSADHRTEKGVFDGGRKIGVWQTVDAKNRVLQKMTYEKNSRQGAAEQWHANGKRKGAGALWGSTSDGLWKGWFPDGKREYEGSFKRGKKVGNWQFWHVNGQKKADYNFDTKTGLKEGLWTTFDRAGNPEEETNYLKGKRHGPHVVWRDFKTKVTAEEGAFVADQPHGPWQFYSADHRTEKGVFDSGRQIGVWQTVDAQNRVLQKMTYEKNGRKGAAEQWHANGKRKGAGALWGSTSDGLWKGWFPDGKREYVGSFKRGKKVGNWQFWHVNGQKKADYNFDTKKGTCWEQDGSETPCT